MATGSAPTRFKRLRAARMEAPVEMTSSTRPTLLPFTASTRAASNNSLLLCTGRDRLDRLGDGVAKVQLRRLLQDQVVVEAERPRHLDRERDAHRRDRDDEVELVRLRAARRARSRPARRNGPRGRP